MLNVISEQKKKMKKVYIVFLSLLLTTLANAQVMYERSFIYKSSVETIPYLSFPKISRDWNSRYTMGDLIVSSEGEVYDAKDWSLLTTIPSFPEKSELIITSKNFFTNDDKVVFLVKVGNSVLCLYDDKGEKIQEIGTAGSVQLFQLNNGDWKMIVFIAELQDTDGKWYDKYDLYSLPGDGTVTKIKAPTTRQNTRKYLCDEQVLIESNEKTYTIQGQEVKR